MGWRTVLFWVALAAFAGCGGGGANDGDLGLVMDAGEADADSLRDADLDDAGPPPDAAVVDASMEDGGEPDAGSDGPFELFVAVDGDDGRDGRSPGEAVATLQRVHEILVAADPDRPVEVRVGPGTYYCGELSEPWSYHNGHPIRIAPLTPVPSPAVDSADDPNRPTFRGHERPDGTLCDGTVWFSVSHGRVDMSLTLEGLAIRHYRGAITLRNPAKITTRVDQNIVLSNMVFERIGDMYDERIRHDGTVLAGKGAILLEYTYGNTIRDSYFHHIRNGEATRGLLHAMYFTSFASRNHVLGNVFHGGTADSIKLTNYSNANEFLDNRFSYVVVAIRDRWCGALEDPATACAGGQPQCPSWNNLFPYERNAWSNLVWADPVSVVPVPAGQDCGTPPAASGVRMDLGTGGLIR